MDAKKIGLKQVIQMGFIGVLTLMILNGAISFVITDKLIESTFWVTHSYKVQWTLEKLLLNLTDAETEQRGYLYTSNELFLEPYEIALDAIADNLNAAVKLVNDNPLQIQRLNVINTLIKQKTDEMALTIALHKSGQKKEALLRVSSLKGKVIMDNIRIKMAKMNHEETILLKKRGQDSESIQMLSSSFSILGGTVLSLVLGIFALWLINRNFIKPVKEVINVIASISTEIAATITQHECTASQQASAANQTSTAIEELSASSRLSSDQAANAAAVTKSAGVAIVQGDESTHQAVIAMADLKQKIATMAEHILHLGEQTSQIGTIATVLKDLAAQINMLALNAGVEAARAGEHGKGFAVVASEIRKLADESKKSAEQTAVLVTDIQKSTNSSILMTEEGSRTVHEVTQIVQKAAELFNNLANLTGVANENAQQVMLNAKQQAAAFNQIMEATNSIAAGAKETAASICQTKVGVQNLNQAAENLKAIV
jgi:methyl-accepting chemotaxis protein